MFCLKEICLMFFSLIFLQFSLGGEADEIEYLNNLLKNEDYEQFSKITRASVNVVRKTHMTFDKLMELYFQEFGDLMVLPEQYYMKPGDPQKHQNGVLLGMWDRVVPYFILPHSYTPEEIAKIEENIRSWNYRFFGVLEFRHKQPNDKNYIAIFNGNGCFTHFGQVGGLQAMSLDANFPLQPCLTGGWTHHEMMHAIGMMHTNNRQDRDFYIKMYPENVIYGLKNFYADITPDPVYPPSRNQSFPKILGPFEYKSLMMPPTNFTPEESYYFDVLRSDIDVTTMGFPGNLDLTYLDEQCVRNLYTTQ